MKLNTVISLVLLSFLALGPGLSAQESSLAESSTDDADAGFGFDDLNSSEPAFTYSGELSFAGQNYFDQNNLADDLRILKASGRLNLGFSAGAFESALKLRVKDSMGQEDWLRMVDEAWARVYLGDPWIEAGLMKQTWGKADSLKVLDVLNPVSMLDLTSTDASDNKIAQLMVHGVLPLGDSLNLEAVWLPFFDDNEMAFDGPWAPAPIKSLRSDLRKAMVGAGTVANIASTNFVMPAGQAAAAKLAELEADGIIENILVFPDTYQLDYFQAGARLSGSVESVDLALQYYYGFLPTPVLTVDYGTLAAFSLAPNSPTAAANVLATKVPVSYNRYQHIGIDAAAVVLTLNMRAEAALNLTEDLGGNKTGVYNPSLQFALGFDRDLVEGISLNVQAKSSIILNHDKISSATDIESGSRLSSTMVIARLGQKLFKETFEWEFAGIWGVDDADFALAPAVIFDVYGGDLRIGGRYFGGNEEGNLGMFNKSSYVEVLLSYQF